MDLYELLSLFFMGSSLFITLLAYLDRKNKRK